MHTVNLFSGEHSTTENIELSIPEQQPADPQKQTLIAEFRRVSRPVITDLIARGHNLLEIRDIIRKQFGVTRKSADNWITFVVNEMIHYSVDEAEREMHIALAIARVSLIFKQAMDRGDLKKALVANAEICRVQGLHGSKSDRPVGNRGKSPSVKQVQTPTDRLSDADLRRNLPDDVIDAEFSPVPIATIEDVDRLIEMESAQ